MVQKNDIPRGVAAVRTPGFPLVRTQFKYPVHWVGSKLAHRRKGPPCAQNPLEDQLTAIRIRQVRAVNDGAVRHCQRECDSGMLTDPRALPDLPSVITIAAALLRK